MGYVVQGHPKLFKAFMRQPNNSGHKEEESEPSFFL
jgi:hypothetical protein